MTRLNMVLLIAVLASALYLVHMQYESRRLYVELEKASSKSHGLETENERLQLEKRTQATPLRIENLAKERLQMRTVTPAITQYARYATPSSASTVIVPASSVFARDGAAASGAMP